jgi:hypothetical protein
MLSHGRGGQVPGDRGILIPVTPRLSASLLLLLGTSLAALACGQPAPERAAAAVDNRGLVTSIRAGSSPGSGAVRVEGPPRPDVRHAKADVAILASTRIVARTGTGDRPAVFSDLELGDRVQVQFEGPVSKSSPVRAVARQIVILEKARGFAPPAPPQPVPTPAPDTSDLLGTGLEPEMEPEPTDPLDEIPEETPESPPEPEEEAPQTIPGVAILRDVRTGDQQTFDRVVFEIEGAKLPDYDVKYVPRPVHCGSGEPVKIDGSAFLQVRLSPAQAHTEEGAPTVATLQRKVRLPVIREIRATCDFEAEVVWVIGLSARKEYRVLELEGPTRLVIDIER